MLIGFVTLVLNVSVFVWIDPILRLLHVPENVYPLMRDYLWVIFWGIGFTFIYNYYASLLRAIGNSVVPLCFLGVAVVLNIVLDLLFILGCDWGVKGAAWATVVAQVVSGTGLCVYTVWEAGRYVYEVANGEGNCCLFILDLCPAVRDEFWYIDGSGANQ